LDELEQETGKKYGLTAAMPCGTSNIANIDIATIAQYLDEFNLMTYDFFGSWSPTTGSNAPVYDQDWGDDDVKHFSVDGCVRAFLNEGVSQSAINIGLPFYGRSFKDAKALNETHGGNDLDTWFVDDGSPQYFNIINKLPNLTSVRHELTQTQYAYKETGGLVSYDDEQAICDKAEYCLEHDLNGFIIWEMTGDLMADLSTPLLDTVLKKLDNPRLDCESLAYDPTTINDYLLRVETNAYDPNPAATLPSQTSLVDSDVQLTCPPDKTGPMQYDGCSGYYQCVFGEVAGGVIPCTLGSSFDEISMLCLPSETAPSCSGTKTSEVQTSSPSLRPQESPTLNPVFDAHVILNDYELHTETPIPSPSSAVLASFATTPEQNSIDVISQNIVCPDEFTGLVPWNQCSIYFYCLIGVPYPPIMQCEAGKLFDVEAKTCLDSLQVTCAPSTEDKNLMQYTISSGVHMGLPNMPTTITQSETSNDESNIRLIAGIVILFCGSLILFLLVLTKRRQSICREF
jgi:chitinase